VLGDPNVARFDENSLNEIEKQVSDAEKKTSAEIVMAVAAQSGTYRDVDVVFGFCSALTSAVFIVFSPWSFSQWFLLPDMVIVFILGYSLSHHLVPMRRMLVSEARKQSQVRTHARAAFQEMGVTATKERNGVFVYVSQFENIVEDFGVEAKVPKAAWNVLIRDMGSPSREDFPARLAEFVRRAGDVLAQAFPPGAENPDEIPNRPRIM
jgi:putative membrane protein